MELGWEGSGYARRSGWEGEGETPRGRSLTAGPWAQGYAVFGVGGLGKPEARGWEGGAMTARHKGIKVPTARNYVT